MKRAFLFAAILGATTALPAQDPDWDDVVRKACTHRRYALRVAAAKKLVQGGPESVAAVRRYQETEGLDRIPNTLVYALAEAAAAESSRSALLLDWAQDRDFYWRSQALGGLARQEPDQHLELFRTALSDPSHLFRIAGAEGLIRAGSEEDVTAARTLLEDEDPRVRLQVGIALVEAEDTSGLPAVVAALGQNGVFLDDPWGPRGRDAAIRCLAGRAEEDFGWRAAGDAAEQQAALERMRAWAREQAPEANWIARIALAVPATTGGLEIRSCRNGDLFLRWTESGLVVLGLEGMVQLELPAAAWSRLSQGWGPLTGTSVEGRVVCDFLRMKVDAAEVHRKVAPGSLPSELASWLGQLADTLREAGHDSVAQALRSRVEQFAASAK